MQPNDVPAIQNDNATKAFPQITCSQFPFVPSPFKEFRAWVKIRAWRIFSLFRLVWALPTQVLRNNSTHHSHPHMLSLSKPRQTCTWRVENRLKRREVGESLRSFQSSARKLRVFTQIWKFSRSPFSRSSNCFRESSVRFCFRGKNGLKEEKLEGFQSVLHRF